jgi:hypothetical protein
MRSMLVKGVSGSDMTVVVRYWELSLMIASVNEYAFMNMAQDAMDQVTSSFFEYDALTQLAVMDLVGPYFSAIPWAADLTGPFLIELFSTFRDDQDVYGMVKTNLVVLAANLYSTNPDEFDVFDCDDFLWFLTKFCASEADSEVEAACACLYFLFK